MRIDIEGHNIELTPAVRAYVEARFARLARHVEQVLHFQVQLGMVSLDHTAEATTKLLPGKSLTILARDPDLHAAIDLLADKFDRALIKHGISASGSGSEFM